MNLVDQAREFLQARDFSVEEKDRNFLVAENPGLGGEKERTCVWVLTQELRHGRQMLSWEDEYLNRFKGALEKYPGARLHVLVDSMEGLSADFRAAALRQYRVRIQVPIWFFDMPFKHEVARTAASAVGDLVQEAEKFEQRRVPQPYEREDGKGEGVDLVPDLLRAIEATQGSQEPWVCLVVAPAGQGKSILIGSLFAQLSNRFHLSKNRHLLYPRPLPMLPAHIREAAGKNVMGLIDAFLRTDVATPTTRRHFEWMIDNRYGLWILDGLDEVITRDEQFLPYLGERITAPGSRPVIVICLRDSLFQTSEELSDFLSDYKSVITVFCLKPWDRSHLRTFAWVEIEGRKPREEDKDTVPVEQFLKATYDSPVCVSLVPVPFYADLLLKTFKDLDSLAFKDEVGLLDLAVTEMCRREYGKGVLREDLLPLPAFREWIEELAVISYESGGVSISDLRELAELLRALVTREIREEEEETMVKQIVMAPFLTRSAVSGRIELTHEILGEYLAGQRFLTEFEANSPRFASRLSQRPWPPDSILFRVLSNALAKHVARLASLAIGEALPADGIRNLIQLLAMTEGGDAMLRGDRLIIDGARLSGVRFHNLNLDGVSFRGCDLTNTDFTGCSLRDGRFEGALLKNTRFTRLPDGGLIGARFGKFEHFDSVIVADRRRIEDRPTFQDWIAAEAGEKETPPLPAGPCPSSLQTLHLFRKFIHVDGQGRRDWLDKRGVVRGRRVPGAPDYEDCVTAAIDFGYLQLEKGRFDVIRRPTGSSYGEMVTFVKSQTMSPGIHSLLDSLCRIRGCVHIPGQK